MTRDTSQEAYWHLRDSGQLSKRRFEVYSQVFHFGPGTSAEILHYKLQDKPQSTLNQSRARFTELRDMGLLKEQGDKVCSITGRRAIVWDVTSQKHPKPLSRAQTKIVKIGALTKLCDDIAKWLDSENEHSAAVYIRRRVTEILGDPNG